MNKNKHISICAGTTCYLMGGAELLAAVEELPEELRSGLDIRGANCLGSCREGTGKPPFVKIGDRIIGNLTPDTLLEELRKAAGEADDEPGQ